MTMTDQQLLALINKICGNQDFQSEERRRDIHRLLLECQQLPGLRKSSYPLYLEALDQTWEWVIKNICAFEPKPDLAVQTSLLKWINGYLIWRIKDLYLNQAYQHSRESSLDVYINENSDNPSTLLDQLPDGGFETPTISGIEGYIEKLRKQKIQETFEQLERYVEEDPDHSFQKCHPRKRPDCNCQLLCQRLLFKDPPEKLTHLSRELGIKYDTIISHWKRKCLPLLQKKLKDLGYSGDEES
ncbi:hypothetical protein LYNGBM3L_17080 [Moorena producens 3L]|uniref:Sigma-70 family RNA polymerase sigma factor n=2 Tax=Coleofasciculaceae TaxID=1892251 RepID=F4XSD5_9CYAN|nr:hypothetical protein [Moorena producens]EGJ32514.1 hypothetical protein LYNGBM3L_17080 [Moorena producens 3L]OLT67110.1 hypothetical protein BI334_20695 [Moorena producens 3L]